ncbi:MAG TPA: UDP-N-acetylmuramate dehydrogenase [Vicinamibacteria bacterium]|nr:UDP-N-acetylmuramate dehydrogenase [Vicinamibacteria bacterium]
MVPGPLDVRRDVALGPLCTLGVGGPARYFLEALDRRTLQAGLSWAADRGLPVLVLGGGSNVVVGDEGFAGLVLHVRLSGIEATAADGRVELRAGAGEEWDPLVRLAVEKGWAGIECLSGIPGRVGATPLQNVGAYGQDVSETIGRVDALELATGAPVSFSNAECRFAYRDSRFKREDRGRFLILAVTFTLRPGGPPAVRYAELERALAGRGPYPPSLGDAREAVLAIRRRKSMVIDPEDPNRRSVGSFFMNPILPEAARPRIQDLLRAEGEGEAADAMPSWPAGEGRVKLSAAWLIERAGLRRGYRRGNVAISTNHTLALVNCGDGTAREVVELAREIRGRVRDRFDVTLEPEPVFVNVAL